MSKEGTMSISLKPLVEQVMVITGASSGIGLATAEAAAKLGAKLVLVARSDHTMHQLVSSFEARGADTMCVIADVGEPDAAERVAQLAIDRYGHIDTWVNNAGVSIYGRLDEIADADARRLFDVNFWGVVRGSLTALKHLRLEGGAIINLGSEVSDALVPLQGFYSASKHAVKGFTDALRVEIQEVQKLAIAVTLIQPVAVDTPFLQHGKNYTDHEPKLPFPHTHPEKVADAIVEAAGSPTRERRVGLMAKLNTTMSRVTPRLARRLEGIQLGLHHHPTLATATMPHDPEGTLYKPGESGQTHSSADAEAYTRTSSGGSSNSH
jgi:short-subunit dehydrogenase